MAVDPTLLVESRASAPGWTGETPDGQVGGQGREDFLGEAVEGSEFERFEGGFSSFLSKGTDHDDGPWRIVHDTLEDFEAAEARHIDIEGDDVGAGAGRSA